MIIAYFDSTIIHPCVSNRKYFKYSTIIKGDDLHINEENSFKEANTINTSARSSDRTTTMQLVLFDYLTNLQLHSFLGPTYQNLLV